MHVLNQYNLSIYMHMLNKVNCKQYNQESVLQIEYCNIYLHKIENFD